MILHVNYRSLIIGNHFRLVNPSLAEHNMPCLSKQCRSRSVGFLTDLDLHCLSLNMWISVKNQDWVIWLAGNWKWAWHLNLFSMTRVKSSNGRFCCVKCKWSAATDWQLFHFDNFHYKCYHFCWGKMQLIYCLDAY